MCGRYRQRFGCTSRNLSSPGAIVVHRAQSVAVKTITPLSDFSTRSRPSAITRDTLDMGETVARGFSRRGRHVVRELHWVVGDHCALRFPATTPPLWGMEATEEKTSQLQLRCSAMPAAFATLHIRSLAGTPTGKAALGAQVQKPPALLAGKTQIGGQPTGISEMLANCPRTFAFILQFSDSAQLGLCVLRTASTIGSGPSCGDSPACVPPHHSSKSPPPPGQTGRARFVMASCGSAKAKRETRARGLRDARGLMRAHCATGIDAQPLSHTSRRPGWW
ncbi:hypothetical protein B0T20DRAFT_501763 [Sordaria brevicollis]|uniref:Uncharacterized protein n=1 Tax=Sordaria brevicollis TaxID=83679 RepID=A0AAE0PAW7_SORBR|nr:hypothetical protein B0T20DRAFT_501763 [Sordaria brevicollis]